MCDDHGHSAAEAAWSAPRVAQGPAVDPVTLPEVEEVRATTMVDNTFDALLASAEGVTRASIAAALPDAWVQTSVGTTYTVSAPPGGQCLIPARQSRLERCTAG
ncbi:hypothetical protein ACFXDH_50860 [Streptomyces sp. NPDC059467]|uniref:hypothetical protein n=1 Tax=Streptomyces sp. NPDC059467 TaxID=3346844 RepID=UPI0036BD490F